jgi:hypothetical protein
MTTGVVLPDAPENIAGRRLFAVHDIEFTVADVARRARLGDRELAVVTGGPAAVQERFRRSRGLLTSDRLTAWLESWSITPDEFVQWSAAPAVSSWTGLVCSGALDRSAAEMAAAAAAACELDAVPPAAAAFDPTGWAERLTAGAVTPEAVQAALAAHRLGWTTIRGAGAFARSRAVAEELRHSVLEDRLDLGIAAARAGSPTYTLDGVLDELEPVQLRAATSGARPGDLVGPVDVGPGWTVLRLDSRTEPSQADPAIVSRAQAAVRTEVIERAVLRHVTA